MFAMNRSIGFKITLILTTTVTTLLFSGASRAVPAPPMPQVAQVWLTTFDASSKLEPQKPIPLKSAAQSKLEGIVVVVDPEKSFQEIDGFGASLTDSSAWLIVNKLSVGAREAVLQKLFSPTQGINLSFLRQPMGASDFALKNYTYDDLAAGETDPTLEKFSIAHDREYIIPLLKRILQINPAVKIMGTPWSPLAWMKTSESVIKGHLKPQAYDWLAQYLVKYIAAYALEGIPIYAISLQNEPSFEPAGYPGMLMNPQDQIEVVKRLGPLLKAAGFATKILIWDHNWDKPEFPMAILKDKMARGYVAGTAFHCYAGEPSAQSVVQKANPDKEIYFTECSGGAWDKSFRSNLQRIAKKLMIDTLQNSSRIAVLWNLALDENYGPQNGGCTNCRGVVTVNQGSGQVDYNVEYYALGQDSSFVHSGAKRISSSLNSTTLFAVAFKNTDGSRVLMLTNSVLSDEDITVTDGKFSFFAVVPGNGVISFVWK